MKFKVGDKVKIRSWEEMEKQYGLDIDGDIDIGETVFSKGMEHLCGEIATITEKWDYDVRLKFENFISDANSWSYTVDMIEKL